MTPDTNETLLVTCPALPEVTSFGDDRADALAHAVGAIEEALAGRMARREGIPAPVAARRRPIAVLPALMLAKIGLYRTMRARRLRKADLVRLLGVRAPQVDRLLDLNHASKLEQIERALALLGRRLTVRIEKAA